MGKRKGNHKEGGGKKKFKVAGFIDPNTAGVYATCNRGKEKGCIKELMNLFTEKLEEYYDLEATEDNKESEENKDEQEVSVEDRIKKELEEMKETSDSKQALLTPIELECECLIFIKMRKPIQPEEFITRICKESAESKQKTTRFTQKLTPITFSVSPKLEEVRKLSQQVLKPHFHNDKDQKPLKFAIQVTRRNFNALEKGLIIKTVAECVGKDHGHSVDLKNYDKLILIECYKTNIGMSVVDDYNQLEKYNLQSIYDRAIENDD